MSLQIKWNDVDPETGEKRFLCAERFAKKWHFKWKLQRRGDWTKGLAPTRAMWEHVLDSLKRRLQRREGVTPVEVGEVEAILRDWRVPPEGEDEPPEIRFIDREGSPPPPAGHGDEDSP